jgi:hypothetical protein
MAKDTTPQKASEAPRRPAVESGPSEANRDAELLEGANATAFVKELLQTTRTLVAQNESLQESIKTQAAETKSLQGSMRTVIEGVTDLYSKIDDSKKQSDPKPLEALTVEKLTRLRQTDWRVFLWQSERREAEHKDSKYHLPRPSIVGRALHDLGAFGKTHWQVAGEIFLEIQAKGPGHLKDLIRNYLTDYVKADGSKDTDIAGKLKKQLRPRLEILLKRNWVEIGGKGCWLTPRGKELFNGWPDYRVQDDDFECLGEFMAASPPIAAKSTASPPRKLPAGTPKP